MAYFITRDYVSQNTTTNSRTYISSYLLAIFLRRILGYTYVGDTNYPINGSGVASTTIAAGSNGATLPQATINVVSTTGFPTAGTIFVVTSTGTQTVAYTGTTATTFTGCSGGTGVMSTGGSVTYNFMLVATGDSTPTVAPTFAAGTKAGIANNGANVEVSIPTAVRMILAADVGRILVLRSILYPTRNAGLFLITSLAGNNTTIAVGSNGVSLPTGTINVASTTGFPTSGTINVLTSGGPQVVTYTTTNATQFLGCTGGTGTMATGNPVNNSNKYVIDYRSNGDTSITEAADTIFWYLYEKDIFCPVQGANNSTAGGYRGNGNSATPRIILQSPHATGYQVRICNEAPGDAFLSNNQSTAWITVVPGFGGDGYGDFPVGPSAQHLHNTLFLNLVGGNSDFKLGNGMGDNNGAGASFQFRYTLIGDNTGQSAAIFARRLTPSSTPNDFFLSYGVPDNEPTPLPLTNIRRLFVVGSTAGDGNASPANNISLSVGSGNTASLCAGAAFFNAPMACHPSLLAFVNGNAQFAGPTFNASAGDCPFTSATELLPIDLIAGAYPNYDHSGINVVLPLVPRLLGSMPFIRSGRTNFGNFALTTDNASWTANAATNATPIQITTSTTNNLVTGQTVSIFGATGNTAANGTFIVTVINNTQFTLNGTTGNGVFSGTATVLRGASYYHLKNGTYIPWTGPAVGA